MYSSDYSSIWRSVGAAHFYRILAFSFTKNSLGVYGEFGSEELERDPLLERLFLSDFLSSINLSISNSSSLSLV
jgi:hypothetical protein